MYIFYTNIFYTFSHILYIIYNYKIENIVYIKSICSIVYFYSKILKKEKRIKHE